MAWLKKKTGPPAKDLSTSEEATQFSSSDDVVVIGFFTEQTSDAAKAFLAAAESQENLNFGISTSQTVADALEAKLDTVVLFKKVKAALNSKMGATNNVHTLLPLLIV